MYLERLTLAHPPISYFTVPQAFGRSEQRIVEGLQVPVLSGLVAREYSFKELALAGSTIHPPSSVEKARY